MITWVMPFLAALNITINLTGIVLAFVYRPAPYGLIGIAVFTLSLIAYIELYKKNLLMDKKQKLSMSIFASLIVISIFFFTLALTMLIYLQLVQNGTIKPNPSFSQLMWQQSSLDQTDIYILSIGYYIGNCFTISFYTRQFYRMFWVNYIVHIFRYLKANINHINESLLNHLPLIKITRQLKKQKCVLCIEQYQDNEKVSKVSCGHVFHQNCIRVWVVRSNACPLCRKRVIYH